MGDAATPRGRSLVAAAGTSAGLSALFLVVYGGCNWITAHRGSVGTCYFEWERHLPFVPALILPYMSIDLFFVAAPFVCRAAAERRLLAKRIVFAILASGVFFLLLPLRFAFERPHTGGWVGAMFDLFRELDRPYNLVPSLHIALLIVLADLYTRHTRGWLRLALQIWFTLIGVSTVLTYQHHLLDVLGGLILGAFCFYLFPESASRLPVVRSVRVGAFYALGAVALVALAAVTWPWGSLLFWPGVALGIVAAAYWGVGPGVFRKRDGRLPASARFVLGPVLAGHHGSLLHYRRRCRPWDVVVPGVWIGRRLTDREAAGAVGQGVTAVLDLTVEFSEAAPFLAVRYCHLAVQDLTAPTPHQLREAATFIAEQAMTGTVYVHCKVGYSRSAAAVGAYLLASGRAATTADAVAVLRQARPSIVIRPEALRALRGFERSLLSPVGKTTMSDPASPLENRRPIAVRGWAVFQWMARSLAGAGVSPNAISLAGMVAGIGAGGALAATAFLTDWPRTLAWLLAALLVQLRLLANMLDGMVAIEGGKASPVGELYNEVPDRVSDAATLIGAGYALGGDVVLGYLAACAALFTAYVRALGKAAGARQEFCGPMAKQQRMFTVTVLALFCALAPAGWQPTDSSGRGLVAAGLLVIVILGLATALRRLHRIALSLRNPPP
jgi:phosphatidylglycerophosphate synthase/membrane-associated phospholipid phosphatase